MSTRGVAALVVVCVRTVSGTEAPWKFLGNYPAQLDSYELESGETIKIDGVLDEPCWERAMWSGAFEDIAQPLHPEAVIPSSYQTAVAVTWDESFLYVAAKLKRVLSAPLRGRPVELSSCVPP